MRKLALTLLVIAFAGACAHKETAPATDGKPADAAPAPTKDQSTPKKKHKKATVAATGAVKCTHGQDERVIEVKDKDGGCETVYTKMGEAKTIATSGHGQDHCKEVSSKIQEHLTGAGFSCQ